MTVVLTTLLLCLTTVAVVILLRPRPAPAAPPPAPPRSILDERLLDYVVVTLKSGNTFGGVLYIEDRGAVVLAKAEQIGADGTKTPADGEIVLLRGDIDFIQRP